MAVAATTETIRVFRCGKYSSILQLGLVELKSGYTEDGIYIAEAECRYHSTTEKPSMQMRLSADLYR
jgi:hypothetical protein